jgi:hypothetical protein
MALFAVLINAAHTALKHTEIPLNRVRRYVAANVFFFAVIDGFVLGELFADSLVLAPSSVTRRLSRAMFSRTSGTTSPTLAV